MQQGWAGLPRGALQAGAGGMAHVSWRGRRRQMDARPAACFILPGCAATGSVQLRDIAAVAIACSTTASTEGSRRLLGEGRDGS